MGRIQSSVGLVSGIDTQAVITQLLDLSARPRDQLSARTQRLQNEQVAITELTALVIGVQISTDRLGLEGQFRSLETTSSQEDVLTAVANAGVRPGQYDFRAVQTAQTSVSTSNAIFDRDAPVSSGDITIRTGGFVDQSATLDELRGGAGVQSGQIRITDQSGESRTIDLRTASTLNDVVTAINNTDDIRVTASIEDDALVLRDTSGGTQSNLIVEDVNGGRTATDLGLANINTSSTTATGESIVFLDNSTRLQTLRDGRGIEFTDGDDLEFNLADGTSLSLDIDPESPPRSLGQLLETINELDPTRLEVSIAEDGQRLTFTDLTTGDADFQITSESGQLAANLGIEQTADGTNSITGTRIQSAAAGPLLSSLNGGSGLGPLGSIDVTNRAGDTTTIDLSSADTLTDVLASINNSSAGITASLNDARTGIQIRDVSGSTDNNLVITSTDDGNETAEQLQIAADVESNLVDSDALNFQFVSRTTQLSDLNQGRGITLGSFTVVDSTGDTSAINLNSRGAETVGDVIDAINSLDLSVEARISDDGDGIVLIDTGEGGGPLTVTDNGVGTAAAQLGIAGSSTVENIDGENVLAITGSANITISVDAEDTLEDVVERINENTNSVEASTLNAGPDSVRLLLTSGASGRIGRISIDGGSTGLTFNSTASARDAIISVGGSDSTGGLLVRSSSNTFEDVIEGLDITITGTSDETVTVDVSETNDTLISNVQGFVDQFNRVADRLDELTVFQEETNQVGLLFGSSEVLRVELGFQRLISARSSDTGDLRVIEQLGLRINENGRLVFDSDQLEQALADDPENVQRFFTDEENGFAARAKETLDTLAGVGNSVLLGRNTSIQSQIDTNNERIEQFNLRLDRQRTRLERQFLQTEQTIAQLQNNLSGLNQLQILQPNV